MAINENVYVPKKLKGLGGQYPMRDQNGGIITKTLSKPSIRLGDRHSNNKPIIIVTGIITLIFLFGILGQVMMTGNNIINQNNYRVSAQSFSDEIMTDTKLLENTSVDIAADWNSTVLDGTLTGGKSSVGKSQTKHASNLKTVTANYETITAHYNNLMTLPSDTAELHAVKVKVTATYEAYTALFDFVTKVDDKYLDFTTTFNTDDEVLTQAIAELQAVSQ